VVSVVAVAAAADSADEEAAGEAVVAVIVNVTSAMASATSREIASLANKNSRFPWTRGRYPRRVATLAWIEDLVSE